MNAVVRTDGQPGYVQVLQDDGVTVVVLGGEIDSDLGRDLAQAADEVAAAGRPVRVDTRAVTFMDSAGLAFLARLCGDAPAEVRVLVASPTVKFLLEMTGMADAIDLVDLTEPDAAEADAAPEADHAR